MGFLTTLSTTAGPARFRTAAGDPSDPFHGLYSSHLPTGWVGSLSAAGIAITPDLAMTLSAYACGVRTIGIDLATLPVQTFKRLEDGGRERVRRGGPFGSAAGGIGELAYLLAWKPNTVQTAAEFTYAMVVQWLMRERAYAEIVTNPVTGALQQLLPRHPDRVFPERLPTGELRYRLEEAGGKPRHLTQGEMLAVRGLSLDGGITMASTVQYGANAIGSALAAERAAARFFKSGMTAAVVATYKGEMGEEDQADLHTSISRYAAGVENSFGLLLIPDDVTISNLGIEPEKAQMMAAREWGVYEVARQLRISPAKLMIPGKTQAGTALEQDEAGHVSNCLRPVAYFFEQAVHSDLILAKDYYYVEFLLEAKFRGDMKARAEYYAKALEGPWMWPSEIRLKENMNPDEDLDNLARLRYRPGTPKGSQNQDAGANGETSTQAALAARSQLKAILAVHDNAIRCLRRERAAVVKLAKKHASDVEGWKAALRDFYADHAAYVAERMRLAPVTARAYAAQHGTVLEANGAKDFLDDRAYEDYERFEADELCALALDDQRMAA